MSCKCLFGFLKIVDKKCLLEMTFLKWNCQTTSRSGIVRPPLEATSGASDIRSERHTSTSVQWVRGHEVEDLEEEKKVLCQTGHI